MRGGQIYINNSDSDYNTRVVSEFTLRNIMQLGKTFKIVLVLNNDMYSQISLFLLQGEEGEGSGSGESPKGDERRTSLPFVVARDV